MISVKLINKNIWKSELLIIWLLKNNQMKCNSDLHMVLLIDFTDIMMKQVDVFHYLKTRRLCVF